MLEETLSSPTYSPAEAALTLISFVEVELAAGGPLAEARFFQLFSMLCDRVFGVITEESADYRHQTGGWLSRHVRWERPRQANASSNNPMHPHHQRRPVSMSVSTDPVVKLLGAKNSTQKTHPDQAIALTLIQAMAKEAEHRPNVRYPFPFKALPKSTQQAWLALLEKAIIEEVNTNSSAFSMAPPPSTSTNTTQPMMMSPSTTSNTPMHNNSNPKKAPVVSDNAERLLGSVFRVKPREQQQLRAYQQAIRQKKNSGNSTRPLPLSPIMFNSNMRSPGGAMKEKSDAASKPKIMLSMLEYYLVLFLRYPLAAPKLAEDDKTAGVANRAIAATQRRSSEAYGDSVYYQLFQEYTNYYIPVRSPQGHANIGFGQLGRPTELFLRICLAFWLEGRNPLDVTEKALTHVKDRKGILDPDYVWELHWSYDLIKLSGVTHYSAPPFQIQRCFHKLVGRAVSDGALCDVVRDTTAGLRGYETLCLSPTLHMLQTPFYNYIRTAFRHASIHARQSPFYTALNDWLLWLEPWNTKYGSTKRDPKQRLLDSLPRAGHAKAKKPSTPIVTYPKANQRSLYKPEWEAYIAANLHMYVIPLAIFLRRARELDFSPKFYKRSLDTVLKVFRVFSPEVVQVINKHLSSRDVGGIALSPLYGIVKAHERNLGDYAPPTGPLSLVSCQNDMHNLLEEIYLQHLKKLDDQDFFDRIITRVDAAMDSWFGSANAPSMNEAKQLQKLVEKAKVIVGFPVDYEVMPESRAASMEAQALGMMDPSMDRTDSGTLTDVGLERILRGKVKCHPEDVDYYGDRMLGRVQTHEMEFLVSLLVKFSQIINAKLGLDPNPPKPNAMIPKRVNLRFLADWRNVMTIIVVYRFVRLFI